VKDQETQTVNPGALKRWKSSGKIEKEVMGLYESCEDGSMKIDRFGDTSLEAKVMEELYDFEKCGGCEGELRKAEMQVSISTWACTTERWSGSWRCGRRSSWKRS
jgi:hypothetical protein